MCKNVMWKLCDLFKSNHVLVFFPPQKISLLQLAGGKQITVSTSNSEMSLNDSFEYVPPKVSYIRYSAFSVCFLYIMIMN